MYSYFTRVRYSETDMGGRLTETALLDYLQDTAIFHAEDLGYSIQYMSDNNIVWVLGAWQINIKELPLIGEEIRIDTYPYRFKGFVGCRSFCILSKDGSKEYANANSVWSLINTETMRPEKVPQSMVDAFLDDDIEIDNIGKKIRVPDDVDYHKMDDIVITPHYLDTNNHVNNAQYVYIAREYIADVCGDKKTISRIRAEYKKQIFLGNILKPRVCVDGEIVLVVFEDEDDKIATIVEFVIR
ncbi:MAG: acyl-[acyl-carrier-protein] thioesterase [Lachnospiraceae bacterium]|nr:acyl-[acyl-carrier-protein] thioesterase [Lachnospiraceae bacterium]